MVSPYTENDHLFIANDDMADFESYYWLAPSDYVSKKLTSYAQRFSVRVSWVKARGDTGGRATRGPDIIIEGDGMKMGLGDRSYHDNNATLDVLLNENNWYYLPDSGTTYPILQTLLTVAIAVGLKLSKNATMK